MDDVKQKRVTRKLREATKNPYNKMRNFSMKNDTANSGPQNAISFLRKAI